MSQRTWLLAVVTITACGAIDGTQAWDKNNDGLIGTCEGLNAAACVAKGCQVNRPACTAQCVPGAGPNCLPCADAYSCEEPTTHVDPIPEEKGAEQHACAKRALTDCETDPSCQLLFPPEWNCATTPQTACPGSGAPACVAREAVCANHSVDACGSFSECELIVEEVCTAPASVGGGSTPTSCARVERCAPRAPASTPKPCEMLDAATCATRPECHFASSVGHCVSWVEPEASCYQLSIDACRMRAECEVMTAFEVDIDGGTTEVAITCAERRPNTGDCAQLDELACAQSEACTLVSTNDGGHSSCIAHESADQCEVLLAQCAADASGSDCVQVAQLCSPQPDPCTTRTASACEDDQLCALEQQPADGGAHEVCRSTQTPLPGQNP